MVAQKLPRGARVELSAEAFGAMVDAAAATATQQASARVPGVSPSKRQYGPPLIKNSTSSNLDRFSVLGVSSIAITHDTNADKFFSQVVMDGTIPDESLHLGRFAVLLAPAKSGDVVLAAIGGVVPVQIDGEGSELGRRAEIVGGATNRLRLIGYGSADVLWRASGTGVQWGVVRFGDAPAMFPVRLTESGEGPIYTVYDMDGRVLDTDVDPTVAPHSHNRPDTGTMDGAQFGFATITNGVLQILQANEIWKPPV